MLEGVGTEIKQLGKVMRACLIRKGEKLSTSAKATKAELAATSEKAPERRFAVAEVRRPASAGRTVRATGRANWG